jgi:hypothetical protein
MNVSSIQTDLSDLLFIKIGQPTFSKFNSNQHVNILFLSGRNCSKTNHLLCRQTQLLLIGEQLHISVVYDHHQAMAVWLKCNTHILTIWFHSVRSCKFTMYTMIGNGKIRSNSSWQLQLTIYSAFAKYSRKNGYTMGRCISYL